MKQHGPWKIKSSEVKYKNPWMSVREDQVVQPDGTDGIYGVIDVKNGVSVLAITEDEHVFLTSEFHYAVGRVTLEAVSGGIDSGEEPLLAAKRELLEEIGMRAKTWIPLGFVNPFTGNITAEAHLFLAKDLEFTKPEREGTEVGMEIIKVPLAEAVEKVMNSEITHAQSCALILKAAKHLGKLV